MVLQQLNYTYRLSSVMIPFNSFSFFVLVLVVFVFVLVSPVMRLARGPVLPITTPTSVSSSLLSDRRSGPTSLTLVLLFLLLSSVFVRARVTSVSVLVLLLPLVPVITPTSTPVTISGPFHLFFTDRRSCLAIWRIYRWSVLQPRLPLLLV